MATVEIRTSEGWQRVGQLMTSSAERLRDAAGDLGGQIRRAAPSGSIEISLCNADTAKVQAWLDKIAAEPAGDLS